MILSSQAPSSEAITIVSFLYISPKIISIFFCIQILGYYICNFVLYLFCINFQCQYMPIDLILFNNYVSFQCMDDPVIMYLHSSLLVQLFLQEVLPTTTGEFRIITCCSLFSYLPTFSILSSFIGFLSTLYFLELKFLLPLLISPHILSWRTHYLPYFPLSSLEYL